MPPKPKATQKVKASNMTQKKKGKRKTVKTEDTQPLPRPPTPISPTFSMAETPMLSETDRMWAEDMRQRAILHYQLLDQIKTMGRDKRAEENPSETSAKLLDKKNKLVQRHEQEDERLSAHLQRVYREKMDRLCAQREKRMLSLREQSVSIKQAVRARLGTLKKKVTAERQQMFDHVENVTVAMRMLHEERLQKIDTIHQNTMIDVGQELVKIESALNPDAQERLLFEVEQAQELHRPNLNQQVINKTAEEYRSQLRDIMKSVAQKKREDPYFERSLAFIDVKRKVKHLVDELARIQLVAMEMLPEHTIDSAAEKLPDVSDKGPESQQMRDPHQQRTVGRDSATLHRKPVEGAEDLQTNKRKMFVSLLVEKTVSETYKSLQGHHKVNTEAIIKTLFYKIWADVGKINFDTSKKLKSLDRVIFKELCQKWENSNTPLVVCMREEPEKVAKCMASSIKHHLTHPEEPTMAWKFLSPFTRRFIMRNKIAVV